MDIILKIKITRQSGQRPCCSTCRIRNISSTLQRKEIFVLIMNDMNKNEDINVLPRTFQIPNFPQVAATRLAIR